ALPIAAGPAAVAAGAAGVAATGVAAARAVTAAATTTVRAATLGITGGLAARSTARAAARLGEASLRVEVLLGRGEHEFLSTVRAGQILVVVHENETPLGSRREPVGLSRVSRERSPSCVELRSGHGRFRGVYERDSTRWIWRCIDPKWSSPGGSQTPHRPAVGLPSRRLIPWRRTARDRPA